jgi:hypothetical protein
LWDDLLKEVSCLSDVVAKVDAYCVNTGTTNTIGVSTRREEAAYDKGIEGSLKCGDISLARSVGW